MLWDPVRPTLDFTTCQGSRWADAIPDGASNGEPLLPKGLRGLHDDGLNRCEATTFASKLDVPFLATGERGKRRRRNKKNRMCDGDRNASPELSHLPASVRRKGIQ